MGHQKPMKSPDSANTMTAKIARPPLESHESTLNSASTTAEVSADTQPCPTTTTIYTEILTGPGPGCV